MKTLAALILALPALAQVPIVPPGTNHVTRIDITVSKQPSTALAATLGSQLSGVAGFNARVCTDSAVTLSGGRLAQWIEGQGVSVVAIEAAISLAGYARRNSGTAKWYGVAAEVSIDAALLIGANFIKANPAKLSGKLLRVAPIVLAKKAEEAKDRLNSDIPDPLARFKGQVLNDDPIALTANGCVSKLFLGSSIQTVQTWKGRLE